MELFFFTIGASTPPSCPWEDAVHIDFPGSSQGLSFVVSCLLLCTTPSVVVWGEGGREVWGSICWSRWDCHPDVGLNPITSIILRFGNGTALILMFCPTNQFIIFSQTYHSLQLANQVHKPDCTLCTSQKVPKILEKGTRRYQYTHTFLHCISWRIRFIFIVEGLWSLEGWYGKVSCDKVLWKLAYEVRIPKFLVWCETEVTLDCSPGVNWSRRHLRSPPFQPNTTPALCCVIALIDQ